MRIDIESAIDTWLKARETYLCSYMTPDQSDLPIATNILYAAFVDGCTATEYDAEVVFGEFQKLLAQEMDRGLGCRSALHPEPAAVAYA